MGTGAPAPIVAGRAASETGLHYNYFRNYDAVTGRYVESDPIGLFGGINTYGYAMSNPLNLSDPSGLFVAPAAPVVANPAGVVVCVVACPVLAYAWYQHNAAEVLDVLQWALRTTPVPDPKIIPFPRPPPPPPPDDCPPDRGPICETLYRELMEERTELLGDLALAARRRGRMTPTVGEFQMDTVRLIRQVNGAIEEYNLHCPKKIPTIPLGPQGLVR
jgi:RHS repeat-associated protein